MPDKPAKTIAAPPKVAPLPPFLMGLGAGLVCVIVGLVGYFLLPARHEEKPPPPIAQGPEEPRPPEPPPAPVGAWWDRTFPTRL